MNNLVSSDSKLLHSWSQGVAKLDAFAADYANFVFGLLESYEASHVPRYLELAVTLQQTYDQLFWDDKDGGYYNTSQGILGVRSKEVHDGAQPSVNSVSLVNLVRLHHVTSDNVCDNNVNNTLEIHGEGREIIKLLS